MGMFDGARLTVADIAPGLADPARVAPPHDKLKIFSAEAQANCVVQ